MAQIIEAAYLVGFEPSSNSMPAEEQTNIFKTKNKMTNTATKQVFLSIEQFDKYLEDCLTIITEPNKKNPYYICEYVSLTLDKSIVHIYIIK